MKFLGITTFICILSFSLSGVFYSYADFDEVVKNTKLGKYNIDFNFDDENHDIQQEHVFKASDIKNVEFKLAMAELTIKESDADDVGLKLNFSSKKQAENFEIKNEKGSLVVQEGEETENKSFSSFFGNNNSIEAELIIPKAFVADYKLKIALGKLDVEKVEMGEFTVKLAAGDIDFEDVQFKTGFIDVAAGDIDLKRIIAKEGLTVKAAAGSVDIEMNQADPVVKIKAAAGDVDFSISEGIKPNLIFNNTSSIGELEVRPDYEKQSDSSFTYGEGKGIVDIKTTFGDVEFE